MGALFYASCVSRETVMHKREFGPSLRAALRERACANETSSPALAALPLRVTLSGSAIAAISVSDAELSPRLRAPRALTARTREGCKSKRCAVTSTRFAARARTSQDVDESRLKGCSASCSHKPARPERASVGPSPSTPRPLSPSPRSPASFPPFALLAPLLARRQSRCAHA